MFKPRWECAKFGFCRLGRCAVAFSHFFLLPLINTMVSWEACAREAPYPAPVFQRASAPLHERAASGAGVANRRPAAIVDARFSFRSR